MMRKLLLTILIGVLLGSATAYGGTHGILAGKVIDEEGKPMIGSTVLVKGTTRGTNVNNKDGSFTIVNIPAGDYEVVVRYVGYAEYVTKVRISADQTTTITARMRTDAQMTDEVVVVGDREMVEKDAVGSQVKISSEEVTQIAREGIAGVIGLSAGVNTTGSGFSVRGSRASETQIRVDGMDVGNQFTGGFGLGGTAYYPMVSSFATEEIQVLTGNFSAEYGEALGGVVNTIVKQGRTDRYEGFLRWRTDVEPLWGYQSDGVEIIKEGNVLKAISAGDGLKFQGPDLHAFDFGFGGPIPLLKNSTFYISSNYKFEKYRSNSYEVIDPYGNNIGQQDNDRTWVRSVTGRLRFGVTKDILLIVGGNWGLSSFEVPSWSWLYNQQHGQIPATANVEERIAQLPVANQLVSNALVRVNHTLSNNMFYEITVSNNSNNDDLAKRALGAYGDPGFFSGFEIWQPQDDYAIEGQNLLPGHNKILDNYESWTALGETADGYFQMDMPVINPLTGFYEGQSNTSGTDNPWGLDRFTITHGNTTPVQIRLSNFWQVEGNFTASLKQGEFNHILKAGLEFKRFELHRHYNGNPYDSNPFFDVYTDKWGGNIYADNEEIFQRTSEPNTPIKASFYLQDQISYKGIILNPGLRFDVFDPNSEYRLETNENFVSVRADSGFGEASAKYQISPRINVSYPITDRSYVSIGYG
ncbi:MAG: carboxypeptidase-like regulatory domain-containing protein, partial [Candidatus Kapaibacterium sp.]